MIGLIPLCFGLALASWPAAPTRLDAAAERPAVKRRMSWWPVAWLLPAVVAWPLAGPGGVVAAGVLTVAFRQERQAHRCSTAGLALAGHTATALRTMVAELRAGSHPVLAAEAAADAVPALSDELRALAGAARLDSELDEPGLPGLAAAWTLARRFGLPMADVLEAARRDVEAGLSFGRRLRAKLAGPRASSVVLAGLPALCLLLGESMGAKPLHVLAGTVPGQLMLVVGAVLLWAGTAWCRGLAR